LAKGKSKRRGEAAPKPAEEPRKSERRGHSYQELSESLIKRTLRAIKEMDVITPYSLANTLNIRLSLARKAIRELESSGAIKVIAKHHSVLVATPLKK